MLYQRWANTSPRWWTVGAPGLLSQLTNPSLSGSASRAPNLVCRSIYRRQFLSFCRLRYFREFALWCRGQTASITRVFLLKSFPRYCYLLFKHHMRFKFLLRFRLKTSARLSILYIKVIQTDPIVPFIAVRKGPSSLTPLLVMEFD